MAISVSLVKVGNSNAVIIPAKVLKQMNIKEGTRFELVLEGASSLKIKKMKAEGKPAFPKITVPSISSKEMKEFRENLTIVNPKDFENDERARYILER